MHVGRLVGQERIGDRELEAISERLELRLAHLLHLVGCVAGLEVGAERPALDGLGEDDGGRATMVDRGAVRGVDLARVVAAAAQPAELIVGEVLDHRRETFVGAEEVLADVRAGLDPVLLELAVNGRVHLRHQHTVGVAGEQVIPLSAPDDLDHVPAGALGTGLRTPGSPCRRHARDHRGAAGCS